MTLDADLGQQDPTATQGGPVGLEQAWASSGTELRVSAALYLGLWPVLLMLIAGVVASISFVAAGTAVVVGAGVAIIMSGAGRAAVRPAGALVRLAAVLLVKVFFWVLISVIIMLVSGAVLGLLVSLAGVAGVVRFVALALVLGVGAVVARRSAGGGPLAHIPISKGLAWTLTILLTGLVGAGLFLLPRSYLPLPYDGPPPNSDRAVLKAHRVVLTPVDPDLSTFAVREEVSVDLKADNLRFGQDVTDVTLHYAEAQISPSAKGWFLREVRFPLKATSGAVREVSRADDDRLPDKAIPIRLACSTACPATEIQVQNLPVHAFYKAQDSDHLLMLPYVKQETAQWSLSPINGDQPVAFAFVSPNLLLLRAVPLPDALVEAASWGDLVLALMAAAASGLGSWSVLKLWASKAAEGGWLSRLRGSGTKRKTRPSRKAAHSARG